MENTTYIIGECFACYSGFKCEPQIIDEDKEDKLRAFLNDFGNMLYHTIWGEVTTCNLATDYERLSVVIGKHAELLKFKKEIEFLKELSEDTDIYLNNEGRLSWYWELDDDFTGGSSGIMPFCYTKEDAGQTWAFSEVKDLLRSLALDALGEDSTDEQHDEIYDNYVFPETIKSDKDLLKYISQHIKTE